MATGMSVGEIKFNNFLKEIENHLDNIFDSVLSKHNFDEYFSVIPKIKSGKDVVNKLQKVLKKRFLKSVEEMTEEAEIIKKWNSLDKLEHELSIDKPTWCPTGNIDEDLKAYTIHLLEEELYVIQKCVCEEQESIKLLKNKLSYYNQGFSNFLKESENYQKSSLQLMDIWELTSNVDITD